MSAMNSFSPEGSERKHYKNLHHRLSRFNRSFIYIYTVNLKTGIVISFFPNTPQNLFGLKIGTKSKPKSAAVTEQKPV